MHVSHCVVFKLFLVEADSSDVEEGGVVLEGYPESAVILFNQVDLSFGACSPLFRLITPVTSPFLFAPWISDLQ